MIAKTKFATPYHSWSTGTLPKGCQLCVQGKKLVLFVTGQCTQRCWYCPVAEQKFGEDVAYANEWRIQDPKNPIELIEEAELTNAKGAGITGGDPLTNIERSCTYIYKLKEKYGKEFHIHLYTPLRLVTTEKLTKLNDAGLDEIRFHLDLDDKSLWNRLNLAKAFTWDIGIEIPAIPGREETIKEIIDFAVDKVDFINLNELERSDTATAHYKLDEKRYTSKNKISYGVTGSESMTTTILNHARTRNLQAHFCTAKLKDKVQLLQRMLRRADHISYSFDEKTKDGTLIRGCAYLPNLTPGFGYRKILATTDTKHYLRTLNNLLSQIRDICDGQAEIDTTKCRFILPKKIIRKKANMIKKLRLIPAIVEEYPTHDALELDIQFL